ncbi:MAG: hypothetical protein US89_C0002G0073 [Candidatus Peregrinibacteria bacterium GW2011_GWF2_38_29]|nr:MAG: hypothetical protein US89_C0002G0073 [Candidatus Peregrinibacteria bacterium GW2011_GWF2_38_29]HBB02230.1 hypothetical protein [Candidatus Peregrinibacteria bacterium]
MKIKENNFFVLLKRTLALSVANIKRNGVLSIGITIVMAILIFIFNVLLVVNFIASGAIKDMSSKVDLVIYLKEDTEKYDAEKMALDIKDMPGIQEAKFVSKEEAFSSFKKGHPDTAGFFEKYNMQNPLPPSIHVIATDPAQYSYIENALKESKYKNLLENIENQNDASITQKVSAKLTEMSSFTKNIILWVIMLFIIGSALIINNAIHITIYSRRAEINIMRLVGAKPIFIRLPFIFEAAWYAILASIIGFILTSFMLWGKFLGGFGIFAESGIGIGTVFLLELFTAITICVLGSIWSVHRNIKKHFLK